MYNIAHCIKFKKKSNHIFDLKCSIFFHIVTYFLLLFSSEFKRMRCRYFSVDFYGFIYLLFKELKVQRIIKDWSNVVTKHSINWKIYIFFHRVILITSKNSNIPTKFMCHLVTIGTQWRNGIWNLKIIYRVRQNKRMLFEIILR